MREKMLKIGEFSKLCKTTIKTLRFYDKINLFKPSFVDENGYRYYSIENLAKLQIILLLRESQMPTSDIKKILNGQDSLRVLESRKEALINNIKKSQDNISLIDNLIKKYKGGKLMNKYVAEKIVIPECVVYYRHGVIKNMANLVDFILEAGEECRKNNPTLKCSGEGYCFVTYEAPEYQENNVELEYCEAVDNFGKESKNIKFKKLDKADAIIVKHKGSYSTLSEAYSFALNYVQQNGYEICGKIRESYVHGCWDCDNEKDYLTIIQVPVKNGS